MTLALAFGTRRMLAQKAHVRSLPVVEIVGAAEVICSDKTGTITEGRMSVRRVVTADEEMDVQEIGPGTFSEQVGVSALVSGLCNNSQRHPELRYVGDPTEVALLEFADQAGADLASWERTGEVPFTSERRMMSVAVKANQGVEGLLLTKGAPEAVLPRCTHIATREGVLPFTDAKRDAVQAQNRHLAGQALRVLGCAYRGHVPDAAIDEEGLIFASLVAMTDPPRPEATRAIAEAQNAGIRIVMITGDNSRTAAAIGAEVGLKGGTMESRDLDHLDEAEVQRVVTETSIFARAEPRHKVMILRALKEKHEVVLMTGDGVNDAPALRNADVGIAMGVKGTDVARDTSDMVLLDDNLATIVAAVEEGRRIFGNIKKFVNYMLTGNLAEVLVILVAAIFGYLPVPAGAMRAPPRHGVILGKSMAALVGAIGVIMALILLATFSISLYLWDLETARTTTFTGFVVQEYLRLLVIRVQERLPILTNKWLWGAVTVSLLLQVLIIYTPIGAAAFGTAPLGLEQWGILLAGLVLGFVLAIAVERVVVGRFGPL